MCQKCREAARKHFPEISDKDRAAILWGATAFPFNDAAGTEAQLKEMRDKIDQLREKDPEITQSDVELALAIADHETEEAMREFNSRE